MDSGEDDKNMITPSENIPVRQYHVLLVILIRETLTRNNLHSRITIFFFEKENQILETETKICLVKFTKGISREWVGNMKIR